MSDNLITWNVPNWITVILMASAGMLVLGMVGKGLSKLTKGGDDNAAANMGY